MRKKLPQGLLHTFFFVKWNTWHTMVIKSAFSIHANIAAGVAFHTHHVVATFQTKKAKNESQNILPFSPCAIRSSSNNNGTNPMKTSDAIPQVGHAAVSKPPVDKASMILRSRDPWSCLRVALLFFFFLFIVLFFKKRAKVRFFGGKTFFVDYFHPIVLSYQEKNYLCTNFLQNEESV